MVAFFFLEASYLFRNLFRRLKVLSRHGLKESSELANGWHGCQNLNLTLTEIVLANPLRFQRAPRGVRTEPSKL